MANQHIYEKNSTRNTSFDKYVESCITEVDANCCLIQDNTTAAV